MPEFINDTIAFFQTVEPWRLYTVGICLIFLLTWVWYRFIREPGEVMAFRTERGRVTVARRAIQELIQRAAARTPGVERCRSRISSRRGKLFLLMRIHLKANYDLREVERRLETQIADTLRYSLGFAQIGRIDTRIVKLVGEPQPVLSYEQRPVPDDEELPPMPSPRKGEPEYVRDESEARRREQARIAEERRARERREPLPEPKEEEPEAREEEAEEQEPRDEPRQSSRQW